MGRLARVGSGAHVHRDPRDRRSTVQDLLPALAGAGWGGGRVGRSTLPGPAAAQRTQHRAGHHGGVADDLEVSRSLVIPGAELRERFSRSSGPGGQGVNTADSRVELGWDVAGSAVLTPRSAPACWTRWPAAWSTARSADRKSTRLNSSHPV